jgi:hypothetical protein
MLFLAATQAGAVVTVSVDPSTVDEMETVMFTLRVSGTNQAEDLNLTPLETDFEVLGSNTSSQFRSVNGRVQSWVEYQISLRPKRTGILRIPPLTLAGETSEAVEIRVNPLADEVRERIDRMIFFETSLSNSPVYVQAQTILTRRLYYSNGVQIYSDLPDMPDLNDAVVIPLGEMRSTTEIKNGERYGVLEQRYAIFPERSGQLVIPEISVTSSIRLQDRGRLRRSGVRVSTDRLEIDVKPIPAEYPPGAPWLPATDVSLSERWDPDQRLFDVGDPLSRTLTVRVRSNTASSISPLDIELGGDGFKQYDEPEQMSDDTSGAAVEGRRTQTYSLIPTRPGPVTVPEVSVPWWDTVNDRLQYASLPARTLQIAGPDTASDTPTTSESAEVSPTPGLQPQTQPADSGAAEHPQVKSIPIWLTLGAISLMMSGWLVAAWLFLKRRRGSDTAADVPPRHDLGIQAYRELKQACASSDLLQVRRALITFVAQHLETSPQQGLKHVPGGDELLQRLNAALYSAAPDEQDQTTLTAEVLRFADHIRKKARHPEAAGALPNLYARPAAG